METGFWVFFPQGPYSRNLQQNHFSYQPHLNPCPCAANRGGAFSSCCRVHVELRMPVFIGKKRPYSQDLLNSAQNVDQGYNVISPVLFRANDKAARCARPSNVHYHRAPDRMLAGKILDRIGDEFSAFELQCKNAPDSSFA